MYAEAIWVLRTCSRKSWRFTTSHGIHARRQICFSTRPGNVARSLVKSLEIEKLLAEPSVLQTMKTNVIARMEAGNDYFLVIAPTLKELDKLAKPLEDARQIKRQILTPG